MNPSSDAAEEQEELHCTAYFWQGRDAGKMGWLTFVFSFRPQMQKLIFESLGCHLAVVREPQQQESMRFMALFNSRMVLYQGNRESESEVKRDGAPKARLFHVHAWQPRTFTQCQSTTNYISKWCNIWIRLVFSYRVSAPWVLGGKHVSNPA